LSQVRRVVDAHKRVPTQNRTWFEQVRRVADAHKRVPTQNRTWFEQVRRADALMRVPAKNQ